MATPEAEALLKLIQQQQAPPEFQKPEAERIQEKVDKATPESLLKDLKDAESSATDLETVVEGARGMLQLAGAPFMPETPAGRAFKVTETVKVFLTAPEGKLPVPENAQIPPAESREFAHKVIAELREKIKVVDVTERTAPYIYRILQGVYSGKIDNVDKLAIQLKDIVHLKSINSTVFNKVREALEEFAKKRGYAEKDIVALFQDPINREIEEDGNGRRYSRGQIGESILQQFNTQDEKRHDGLDIERFFNSLLSAEEHDGYFFTKQAEIKAKLDTDPAYAGKSEEEKLKAAREETVRAIHRSIIYMIHKIYLPMSNSKLEGAFDAEVSKFGDYMTPNPNLMYQELQKRLNTIAARQKPDGNRGTDPRGLDYLCFKQVKEEGYDEDKRKESTTFNPVKKLSGCNYNDYANSLLSIAGVVRGIKAFKHDYEFAFKQKKTEGDDSFYGRIAAVARANLPSETVDLLHILEYNDIVQAAKVQIEYEYKLLYSSKGWQETDDFLKAPFQIRPTTMNRVRNSMLARYMQKGVPEIVIDGCINQAAALVDAARHVGDALESMLLPMGHEGYPSPNYKGQAGRRATFNAAADILRWNVGALTNVGEVYLSTSAHKFDVNDQNEEKKRMEYLFRLSQVFGQASYNGDKVSGMDKLRRNFTQSAGYDRGGWAVFYAQKQWLEQYLDPHARTPQLRMFGPEEDITNMWRTSSEIGINTAKNLMEELLFKDAHMAMLKDKDGEKWKMHPLMEKKYMNFFGYLYDRYFNYPDSVGNVYVDGMSKQAYLDKIRGLFESGEKGALQAEVYNAMTVMLFERSPVDFLTMEMPMDTQNGITLMEEVRNKYLTTGRGQLDEYKDGVRNLIFVMQESKRERTEKMDRVYRESEQRGQLSFIDLGETVDQSRDTVINTQYIKDRLSRNYTQTTDNPQGLTYDQISADPNLATVKRQIDNSLFIYETLRERVVKPPEHNTAIDTFIPPTPLTASDEEFNDIEKEKVRNEFREKLVNAEGSATDRMQWWSKEWKGKRFNLQFASDTADKYMDYNRTGPDTVARAAEFVGGTAEVMKKMMGAKFVSACAEAASKREFDPLYHFIAEIKEVVDLQDEGLFQTVILPLIVKRIINTFHKDKKSEGMGGDVADAITHRPGSVSETYTQMEDFQLGWSWTRVDVLDFLQGLKGLTGGGIMEEKEVYDEMRIFGGASPQEMFVKEWLKLFAISILAVIILAGSQGAKEFENAA